MRKILIATTLLFPIIGFSQINSAFGGGTTILTFIRNDSIIIAADSKHTLKYIDKKRPNKVETINKIRIVGKNYFAISGTPEVYHDDKKVLDAFKIFANAIKSQQSVVSRIDLFTRELNTQLHTLVDSNIINKNILYNALIGNTLFKITYVYFESKTIINRIINCNILKSGNDFKVISEIENLSNKADLIEIGVFDHIDTFLNNINNQKFFKGKSNIISKLEYLIKIECKKHPLDVGCPINFIIIKKNKYYTFKKNCYL